MPGRYVGAEAVDDDDEAFNEKMERLTAQLAEQMVKEAELDALIREKQSHQEALEAISPSLA